MKIALKTAMPIHSLVHTLIVHILTLVV